MPVKAKAQPPDDEGERERAAYRDQTAREADLMDALRTWKEAKAAADVARAVEEEARRQLVVELKAAGIEGFVL